MNNKILAGIIGLGACSSLAALVAAPNLYPVSLATFGGALGGAAVVGEARRKKEQEIEEAARVATAFNGLYEANRGLVSPQQLSFLCGVPTDKTSVFLQALCDQQGGKRIPTDKGEVFNFPHPANVLDQLTNNAQAWAKSQADPLLQENANLKAELVQLKAVLGAQAQQPLARPLKNNEEQPDPWNKLL